MTIRELLTGNPDREYLLRHLLGIDRAALQLHMRMSVAPQTIRELAAFIDARMKDVQKGTGTADPHRVAILTALTISEELHRLQKQYAELEKTAENAARHLLEITSEAEGKDP